MAAARTVLTLVRHGQTSANLDGVWHGSTNTPLTPHGHRQAEAAAAWIEAHHHPVQAVGRVYASPLDRAHHTAQAIGRRLRLEPTLDPTLAEYDLGEWEGLGFEELFREKRLFENLARDPHYAPHGGESPLQVGQRIADALVRIARAHPGERVVVVSHSGALSIGLGLLLDRDYTSWERRMHNCALSELVIEPEPTLISFNFTDHLPPDPDASGDERR